MILAGWCGGHRRRARPFLAIGREQLLPPSAAEQKLPKEVPCFPGREKALGGREPCGGAEGPFPAAAARTRPALPAAQGRLRSPPGRAATLTRTQRAALSLGCPLLPGLAEGHGAQSLALTIGAGLQKHHTDPCITRGAASAEGHKSCFVPSARL